MRKLLILVIYLFITSSAVYAAKSLHHQPPIILEGEQELPNRHSVPNFAANPTIVSKQSGSWFDVSTWSDGRIPGIDDVVKIEQGHAVNYNSVSDSALAALGIKGTLTFDTAANSRIKVGTILVYREGKLDVGTQSSPIKGNAKVEIIIANRPLATFDPDPITAAYDPLQFGTGLIVFGEVNMHGKALTPTWVRLALEPLAGQNTLTLETIPLGWSVGDKIVLPDTRQTPIVKKYSKVCKHLRLHINDILNKASHCLYQKLKAYPKSLTLKQRFQYLILTRQRSLIPCQTLRWLTIYHYC